MSLWSPSANKLRDPDRAPPTLLPVIDTAPPTVIIHAPHAPRKSSDASASGVLDAASDGSVPSATICASVITVATIAIVINIANGTARVGSRASPAGTGTTSYPPY